MRLHRDQGPRLTLQAGQQKTHLVLHPGEAIRTPRTLLVSWEGDVPLRGHNLLRRSLLEHYVPRIDGEVAIPPLTHIRMSWADAEYMDMHPASWVES